MATATQLKLEPTPLFKWYMDRLEPCMMKKNKLALTCLQAIAVYYACLGIKRSCSTFSLEVRNKKAVEAYRDFVVPHFMQWMEEQGYRLPSWVTKDLMGHSTLNGTTSKFFDVKLKVLWNKFSEIGWAIRTTHTPIYDGLMIGGQPPSGQQIEDIAEQFTQKLWSLQPGSKRVVKNGELWDEMAEGTEAGTRPDTAGNGEGTHIEEIDMPEDYVHELSLAFALFGRPSPSPDHDLALSPNNGPKNKKRRTSDGPKRDAGDDGGDKDLDNDGKNEVGGTKADLSTLSRHSVKMMVAPGESQSRGDVRKFSSKENARGAVTDRRRELLDLVKSPPPDAQQEKMATAVENIGNLLAQKTARDERKQEIVNLQGEINMLISFEEHEEARKVKLKLLKLFRTPATVPAMPAPAAPIAEPAAAGTPALDVSGKNGLPPSGIGGDGAAAEKHALDVSGANDHLMSGTGGGGATGGTPVLDISDPNDHLTSGTGGGGATGGTPVLDISDPNDHLTTGTGGGGATGGMPVLDISDPNNPLTTGTGGGGATGGTPDALPSGTRGGGALAERAVLSVSHSEPDRVQVQRGRPPVLQEIDGNSSGWGGAAWGEISI